MNKQHQKSKGRSHQWFYLLWIQDYPVTASYDEAFLYIETTSARSDIQIRILDGAAVVYETTLYAPDTFIAISLEQLEDGTYGVELTNQWGDYLYGEFER